MTAELRFHRAARAELIEAITYYKAQRSGYGDKFAAEVEKLVERIVELPGSGAPRAGYPPDLDVHAYRLRTFPYSLIVANVDGERMVFAVAHERRKPGYWVNRLSYP